MLLLCFSFVFGIAFLAIGILHDPELETTAGMFFMVSSIILVAPMPIILMIAGELLDRLLNGRGVWSREINQRLSVEQKGSLVSYLRGEGFSLSEENSKLICSKDFPGFFSGDIFYIEITDGYTVNIEAYRQRNVKKNSVMYGIWGVIFKRGARKKISRLLDIIDAPDDIRV